MPPNLRRRTLLLATLASASGVHALPQKPLSFPRDHGAHNSFRTEWWYITGRATSGAREFGFQITFFRSRVDATQAMQSRFAAKQLIFAHAALTDLQGGKLWHDQRIARASGMADIKGTAGMNAAQASEADTDVRLRDWSLQRQADASYAAHIAGQDFALNLRFIPTQPLLLQGAQGLSRKGPDAAQASYYYSQPQLATRGTLTLQGKTFEINASQPGVAWLDHEWSEALMAPNAVGWDWIGMNLLDGSALTAFRLRDAAGNAVWAGGSFRAAAQGSEPRIFSPAEVQFEPLRGWTSPQSQASYPVLWRIHTPAGSYTVKAALDQQELDSRQSTGAIYWEGLSELLDSQGRLVGRGYLEMTGYADKLRL
ncbi:MAG: carotenoid 1,2-hydratase [Gammaproteobacteria bacterium]|nr:carotenoid 1,2-hydratase [Gammaproteobacteria bacterium]MBU0786169.1 carotenoid 1,2-hydratase [Gammaproteobacteria bacterium]MBU0816750.1 carotenoid 1,2-hydratase [Gammaproteobacteria bacterium]MBU1786914.1 carotenoid 1,2-hydratase [Gammaproteobacteria bacterium]